jgi:DNA adenine methylase
MDASIFVKSLGGKSALVPQILELMPERRFRYHEPFLGGGAVFLALANRGLVRDAHLGDMNLDLVCAWNAVLYDPLALMRRLDKMVLNDAAFYDEVRARDRAGGMAKAKPIDRAARFVFLNKACWGGVWRTNSRGEMNAPFGKGRELKRLYDPENVRALSDLAPVLGWASVAHEDFEAVLKRARKGDVAYFDPPYIQVRKTTEHRSFTRYTKDDFTMADQVRLRDATLALARRGVRVVISNSSAPEALELYDGRAFTVHEVHARRSVNSRSDDRQEVPEILVTAGP